MRHKYSKRIIIMLILSIVMFNMFGSTFSNAAIFSDVKETSWYYKNLSMLTNMKVIDGFPDGTFKPNDALTKEQFIKLLITCINPSYDYGITKGYWFEPYMNYAFELGIIENKSLNKEFNVNISREEVSYLASRAMNIGNKQTILKLNDIEKEKLSTKMKDVLDINQKYLEAVLYLYDKEILTGFTDGTFKPKETLTRSQAVTIIAKIINYRENLKNQNLLDYSLIKGYELQSEIDNEDLDAEFKITQNIYSTDYTDEIQSILD